MDISDIITWWWEANASERAELAIACGGDLGDAIYIDPDDFIIQAVLANPALIGW